MLIMTNDEHINDYGRIVKYHEDIAGFDFDEIRKVQALLYRKYNYVCESLHFDAKLNHIFHENKRVSLDTILKYGHVFEYKMLDNKYLYRIAIRLSGRRFDTIYVIQPTYYNGNIFIALITCYANSKEDRHNTLNVKRYV